MKFLFQRLLALRFLFLAAAGFAIAPTHAQGTLVRLQTTQGLVDMQLYDSEAPVTVANFLAYVRGGDYANVMVHRSARLQNGSPFVIQAGAYRWLPENAGIATVTSRGAIANEFSAARSNVRGSVAMAKVPDNPNSATSQWFVNMANNTFLDSQNGGFTVFARVTAPGMVVSDRIAALQVVNANSTFTELPVANYTSGNVLRTNTVLITAATELPVQTPSDRIFNYLEATYPQFLTGATGTPGQALGYLYRYYSGANAYAGTKDGMVWYWLPSVDAGPRQLGSLSELLSAALGAGY